MANQVTTKDRVDYLVKRRFPLSYLLNILPSLSGRGHDVSPELIEAVERRGVQVADWKSLYEQAVPALKGEEEEHERQIADWKKLFDQAKAALDSDHAAWLKIADEKNQTIEALEERVASLEESNSKGRMISPMRATTKAKQLGTKGR